MQHIGIYFHFVENAEVLMLKISSIPPVQLLLSIRTSAVSTKWGNIPIGRILFNKLEKKSLKTAESKV